MALTDEEIQTAREEIRAAIVGRRTGQPGQLILFAAAAIVGWSAALDEVERLRATNPPLSEDRFRLHSVDILPAHAAGLPLPTQLPPHVGPDTWGKPVADHQRPDGKCTVTEEHRNLAAYIVEWFGCRNAGEFEKVLDRQRVMDRRLMLDELAMILAHGGRPPNWVK